MTRGQQLAVAGTCLLAAVTYAGAVTTWTLAAFVLPGVAAAALLASPLAARRMSGMAIGIGLALVLGWAELANIWTGGDNGPVARSTFFAAAWTVVAAVLAHSRWPALFLAGVAGVVLGAVDLGAAGDIRTVVVAAAVCAALTLGSIEQSRRKWASPPRRGVAVVLLSLLVGAVSAAVVLLQAPKVPSHDSLTQVRAAQHRTNLQPKQPKQTVAHATRPDDPASARRHAPRRTPWRYVVVGILLFLLAIALVVAARLLSTRFAWRRVRRRLATGAPAEQVTGAWTWTRLRLDACRLPLPVDVSPDLVVAGRASGVVPTKVDAPLQVLAAATTTAAFAPRRSLSDAEVAAAWTAAGMADESARRHLTRLGRARLAFRGPASTGRSR
jgi:hypothetical protein